jgi:hypothetical protein
MTTSNAGSIRRQGERIEVSRDEMIAWMSGSTPWIPAERDQSFALLTSVEAAYPGQVVFYRSSINDRQTRTVALRDGASIHDAKKLFNINRNSLHGRVNSPCGVPAAVAERVQILGDGHWLVPFADWRPHDRGGRSRANGDAAPGHHAVAVATCPRDHYALTATGECPMGC